MLRGGPNSKHTEDGIDRSRDESKLQDKSLSLRTHELDKT
jgi:hypothetical protein